jgi:glyoxylase-like metal-dependent hydrolase (beta-lactamase superfamily II)
VIHNIAADATGLTSNAFLVAGLPRAAPAPRRATGDDTGADRDRDADPAAGADTDADADADANTNADADADDTGTGPGPGHTADDARTVLVDAGAGFDAVSHVRSDVGDGLDAVVLTHTHSDHVGNVDALREAFGVETSGFDPDHPAVDRPIADGDRLRMGRREFVALHTPGHREDHLCFLSTDGAVLFAGDLVFADGGFGRTDLPGGDRERLIASIDRLLETADEGLQELHAGHGPSVVDEPYRHLELAAEAARVDY